MHSIPFRYHGNSKIDKMRNEHKLNALIMKKTKDFEGLRSGDHACQQQQAHVCVLMNFKKRSPISQKYFEHKTKAKSRKFLYQQLN